MPVQAHNNPALQQGSTIALRPLTRELTWLWHLPLVLVLGWWILDLQVQWRAPPGVSTRLARGAACGPPRVGTPRPATCFIPAAFGVGTCVARVGVGAVC